MGEASKPATYSAYSRCGITWFNPADSNRHFCHKASTYSATAHNLHNIPQAAGVCLSGTPGLVRRQPGPRLMLLASQSARPVAAGYHGTSHSLRRCRLSEPFVIYRAGSSQYNYFAACRFRTAHRPVRLRGLTRPGGLSWWNHTSLAGMAGFEPADVGVKVPCLTAWLHPCVFALGRSLAELRPSTSRLSGPSLRREKREMVGPSAKAPWSH